MNEKLKVLKVSEIFTSKKYEIPIYQRNYAWKLKQIEDLIDDIYGANGDYFLGNLIVNQKDKDIYEVIDGQQRLTTLYLLQKYLGMNVPNDSLYFEAREKSNRTLSIIGTDEENNLLEELKSEEIIDGYNNIERCFNEKKINSDEVKKIFREKLNSVYLIRVQVPKDIDLDHYFEIMNTRGEQLELHEIAKAKLLGELSNDIDKKVGAIIWDACSKMDTYVQMNFDSESRKKLFLSDNSNDKTNNEYDLDIQFNNFDEIVEKIKISDDKKKDSKNDDNDSDANDQHDNLNANEPKELIKILEELNINKSDKKIVVEENERFESIISFPNFILHVNKVINGSEEMESMLDDKNLLKNIQSNWQNEEKAKNFLYNLLKCRVLFDKYIIKREFAKNHKESGKWSLQSLKCYEKNKFNYVNTFDEDKKNKILRTLQACLRITYTSPKTMHWISLVLKNLIENENCNILKLLEDYCDKKVEKSNYRECSGFEFERIVFTYLDYILYRDGYSYEGKKIIRELDDEFEFQFRNSIEHFYPQNPSEKQEGVNFDTKSLNSFGNLALITVSGNSKFSNLLPAGKVKSYPSIIKQSLKLRIMEFMINSNGNVWSKEILEKHKEEMFKILG